MIQLEELPKCYRADEPFTVQDELDEMEGRSHRKRTVVNYNDGLDDDTQVIISIESCSVRANIIVCKLGSRGR